MITPAGPAVTKPKKAVSKAEKAATKNGKAAAAPAQGSSCEVTVAFTGLAQVPQTAALVIDQPGASSAVTLTVSRDVSLLYYLGIPALGGLVLMLALLVASVLFLKVYGWDSRQLTWHSRAFWRRSVLGFGAWTLSDSWATNISTVLVVVGSVLTTTTAVNSLFPGVALDRFALVNLAAGGIVVAAPVVFGIYYSRYTGSHPGLTADATVRLQGGAHATIKVPSGASITASGDTTVSAPGGADLATVRAGYAVQVPSGATISVRPGPRAVGRAIGQTAAQADPQADPQAVTQAAMQAAVQAAAAPAAPVTQAAVQAARQALVQVDQQTFYDAIAEAVTRGSAHGLPGYRRHRRATRRHCEDHSAGRDLDNPGKRHGPSATTAGSATRVRPEAPPPALPSSSAPASASG